MSGYVIIFYFIFTHFLEIFTLQRKILDGDLVLVPTESKKTPKSWTHCYLIENKTSTN
jgi:hypothetical protein